MNFVEGQIAPGDMLLMLSQGNANIGTRLIQVNRPTQEYLADKAILELIIMLLPGKLGTVLIDPRIILEAAKMA